MESIQETDLGGSSDPRVLLAAERTLLAWVRTGLAMMGFGFVVARFGLSLEEIVTTPGQVTPPAPGYSLWIGAALILLGVITNILSAVQHMNTLDRLRKGEKSFPSKWSLSLIVTATLAALGIIMTVCLLASANLNQLPQTS